MSVPDALSNGPVNFLQFVDQKVGIEVFKLGIVLSTVYFVQGMGGLSNIPLLFYFKDILHFTESQVQYFSAITGIAWLVKPLFGFISDRWPIFGYRRKSYMIMNAVVASLAWFTLALMVSKGVSQYAALVLVFNLSSLGYAFVDVVCDGLMVQRGKELNAKMEKEGKNQDKLKNLVNLQWFAIGISGFVAGFAGGHMQAAIKEGALSLSFVFILSGIVPLLTATIAWFCVNEEKVGAYTAFIRCSAHDSSALKDRMFWFAVFNCAIFMSFGIFIGAVSSLFAGIVAGIVLMFLSDILYRERKLRKACNDCKSVLVPDSASGEKVSGNHALIKSSVFRELLTSRMFWLLTAFIFFWHYSPSFGAVASYYNIDVLGFDEKFLGLLSAIGNALFPLSIVLYYGMVKWFPKIRTKTYLYASIAISMVYYAISYLFYLPPWQLDWVRFSLPGGGNILVYWAAPLAALAAICWLLFRRLRNKTEKPGDNRPARILFVLAWALVAPLSMVLAAWFSDVSFAPFVLSYRSLAVLDYVVFGYLTIAAFLIPLSLAGELAPSKGEAMTYAYFMALINVSKSFIPDISGAKMFEVLKEMLTSTSATITAFSSASFLLNICLLITIVSMVLCFWKLKSGDHAPFREILWLAGGMFAFLVLCLGLALEGSLIAPAWRYVVQQSFLLTKPIIGHAMWLGMDEYRCLILKYSVMVGAFFTLISAYFVYILKIPEKKKEEHSSV
jgi:hypothetical protein